MVVSSHVALNKVGANSMRELYDYIYSHLNQTLQSSDLVKPVGLHFVVQEKIFTGTNQPFISCPIQFRLRDLTSETVLCRPVWTEQSLRSKVNRKARIGVKRHSVIRIDDYSVVAHEKAITGYVILIRSYHVVKKEIDIDDYQRWIS